MTNQNAIYSFEHNGTKYDIVSFLCAPGEIRNTRPARKELFMGIITAFENAKGRWTSYIFTPWQLNPATLSALPSEVKRHPLHDIICKEAVAILEQHIKTA